MKAKSIFLLCTLPVLFLLSSCNYSEKNSHQKKKTIGALTLDKAKPKPGDNLKLRYVSESSDLADDDFSAYRYILVNDAVYAYDMKMKQTDSLWKAQISIPDSATAVAFNFKIKGDNDTNGGKGFVQPLYDDKGEVVRGGMISVAGFHQKMDDRLGYEVAPDSLIKWYQTGFKKHPETKKEWSGNYANLLFKEDRSKGEAYVNEQLKKYRKKNNPSEKDYEDMFDIYAFTDQNGKKDSIAKKAAADYPHGKMAGYRYFQRFKEAGSKEEKQKVLKEYKADIDNAEDYKNALLTNLAGSALEEGDMSQFEKYILQISDKQQAAAYLNYGASYAAESDKDYEEAEGMIKKALAYADPETEEGKPDFMTRSEYKDQLKQTSQSYRDTYALILFKQGRKKEALSQQEKAVQGGQDDEINENYIKYLMANEKYGKAEKEAGRFIEEATATGEVKTYFKQAYAKNEGSVKGLEEALSQMEKKGSQKVREQLKKNMLDKRAPDVELADADGKTVSLDDLKGKTVILDFWATWCGPCVASFPGMKKAVDHYKDDPDVKFYFVNTFQREDHDERHKKVADFMEQHHYPFEILYDKNDHNDFKTASAFGITGIPTKIILGPHGKWQFTKVGYGGNNDKLMKEIETMIELVKS